MSKLHKPGESASHLAPSALAIAHLPGESRQTSSYKFTYTGEYRKPVDGEFFRNGNLNVLYWKYDSSDYPISWIVTVKERPRDITVTFTDGRSIESYSFRGGVDWPRLEHDLEEAHAQHAIVEAADNNRLILLGAKPQNDDLPVLLNGEPGWTCCHDHNIGFTKYLGWFVDIRDRDKIMQLMRAFTLTSIEREIDGLVAKHGQIANDADANPIPIAIPATGAMVEEMRALTLEQLRKERADIDARIRSVQNA